LDFGFWILDCLAMDEREFKDRTRQFGLRVMEALPDGKVGDVLGRQLLRAATSVGANYRAACRAKSRADMIAKLGIVEEEADEAVHWLGMLSDANLLPSSRLSDLIREGDEIVAMVVSSIRTLRAQIQNPKSKIQNAAGDR
jgi:four helix bundle protein